MRRVRTWDETARRRAAWVLCGMAAVVPSVVAFCVLPAIPTNDAPNYLALMRTYPPVPPGAEETVTLVQPPGYPLFLDALAAVAGLRHLPAAAAVAQQILSALSVVLLYRTGLRLGRRGAGLAAAVAYGLYVPRLLYGQAFMAETLFTFLLLLAAWCASRPSVKNAACAGFAVGAAMLVKFLGAPLVLLVALGMDSRKKTAAFLVPAAFCVAALAAHGAVSDGPHRTRSSLGRHLADHAYAAAPAGVDDPGVRIVRAALAETDRPHRFPGPWWDYWHALKDGRSPLEADRLLLRASIATATADPAAWIVRSWKHFKENAVTDERRYRWEEGVYEDRALGDFLAGREPVPAYAACEAGEEYPRMARTLGFYEAPDRLGRFGREWLAFWDRPLFRFRGNGWGILFAVSFAWGAFFAGAWRPVVWASLGMHAFAAVIEMSVPRYSEPLVPVALLTLTLAAAAASEKLQGLRTIFPKF